MNVRMLAIALLVLTCTWASASEPRDLTRDIEACPEGKEWMTREQARAMNAHMASRATQPTMERLRQELLQMQDDDQRVRQSRIGGSPAVSPDARAVDGRNLTRLKAIVDQYGFPTAAMVGIDGVGAAWLVAQHADTDLVFQERVLGDIAARGDADGISRQQIALLTDQVRLARGSHQLYGTKRVRDAQSGRFEYVGGLDDPDHLDERRTAMGLMPAATDLCLRQRAGFD